jgi:hypothetical protein
MDRVNPVACATLLRRLLREKSITLLIINQQDI